MSIRESLMAAGSFEINLRDTTPWTVRRRFSHFGYLCITPGVLSGNPSSEDVRLAAKWTGILDRVEGDMTSLIGRGLVAVLGDQFRGRREYGNITHASRFKMLEFGQFSGPHEVETLLTTREASSGSIPPIDPAAEGLESNGIMPGAISTATLVPAAQFRVLFTEIGHDAPTKRELLDLFLSQLSPMTAMEWRCTPQGDLDLDYPANVFQVGQVILGGDVPFVTGRGTGGAIQGLPSSEIRVTAYDFERLVSRWTTVSPSSDMTVAPGGTRGDSATTAFTLHAIRATGKNMNLAGHTVVGDQDVAAGTLNAIAADTRAQYDNPRRQLEITIEGVSVRRYIEPGDQVYVYDLDRGVVDPAVWVRIAGAELNPVLGKVYSVDWPITEGHGVYYIDGMTAGVNTAWSGTDDRVENLTEWIEYEDPVASVTVGDRHRTISDAAPPRRVYKGGRPK